MSTPAPLPKIPIYNPTKFLQELQNYTRNPERPATDEEKLDLFCELLDGYLSGDKRLQYDGLKGLIDADLIYKGSDEPLVGCRTHPVEKLYYLPKSLIKELLDAGLYLGDYRINEYGKIKVNNFRDKINETIKGLEPIYKMHGLPYMKTHLENLQFMKDYITKEAINMYTVMANAPVNSHLHRLPSDLISEIVNFGTGFKHGEYNLPKKSRRARRRRAQRKLQRTRKN